MNTPNKLTLCRIIVTPFFLFFLITDFVPYSVSIANLIFILASITDLIDGKIARKYNLITDFGKFLDPLADKMLMNAAFIGLMCKGFCLPGSSGAWLLFIVLTREFLVTSLRLVASNNGKVIAAGMLGKIKTVFQMIAIIAVMTFVQVWEILPNIINPKIASIIHTYLYWFGFALLWIATIMTVVSGIDYIAKNKEYINPKK
jgi:CDP-diacylglycerol--glycerol-3-phosphate 3-phosphatidyltransferase